MSIEIQRCSDVSEAQAVVEMTDDGFLAAAKAYEPGKTEAHRHDYDICLQIVEGEFRLGLVDENIVRICNPGDRVFVPAGTLHFEDHGALRMVVGRRHPANPRTVQGE